MNRFISVSLAVLLGFVSAQEMSEPLFLASGNVDAKDVSKISCYLYDSYTFFDLRALTSQQKVSSLTSAYQYNLGICQYAQGAGDGSAQTFAYRQNIGGTGGKDSLTDSTYLPEHIYTLNSEDGVTSVQYIQGSKTECRKLDNGTIINYQITVNAMCNPDNKGSEIKDLSVDDRDLCNPKFKFSNEKGCPVFKATGIIAFIEKNPWIIGTILIAFGIVSAFFGGRLFPKVLMAAFGGTVFAVVILVLSAIGMMKALEGETTGQAIGLTILGFIISFGAAFIAGWFINRIQRAAFMAVGGLAGFFIGFLLYSVLILKFYQATWLYVLILVVCIALGAFVVYRYDKAIIIYLTAFLGGYALIRGISVFAGGYVNEMTLAQQIMDGTFNPNEMTWQFWMYIGSFVVTTIVGVIVQRKYGRDQAWYADYVKVY